MQLDLATAEYIGAREQQQDLATALPLATGALLVLADGLGGHESGADASRIVVTTFKEAGAAGRFKNPASRRQALREVLDLANARIAEGVDPAHGHRGMASTVVAAIVENRELRWVSVGDSHLYLWRGGRLHKLNEDHSQAGLMIRSGQYQKSDPEVQAVKSVLVSALTGRKLEIVDLPLSSFRLEVGDVLILASDGLNTLSDDEIEEIVDDIREHGAIKLSTTLLESVRSRRLERQDNTTVVIARVLEPARVAVPTAPVRRPVAHPEEAFEDDSSEERTQRITADAERPATTPEVATSSGDADAAGEEEAPIALEVETPAAVPEAPRTPALKPRSGRPEPPRLRDADDKLDGELLPLGAAPADVVPEIQPAAPRKTAPQAVPASAGRSGLARGLVLLVLLLLLASGVAIAALKPGWLSGVVPGFGESVVPAPEPVVPAVEPAAVPKALPEAELKQAPAPAPAVAPTAEPATTAPASNAAPEAARAAIPSPAPAAPASAAAPTPPATAANGPSAKAQAPAPAATDAAAPAPTPQATPQLVEPERPAPRPGERVRTP